MTDFHVCLVLCSFYPFEKIVFEFFVLMKPFGKSDNILLILFNLILCIFYQLLVAAVEYLRLPRCLNNAIDRALPLKRRSYSRRSRIFLKYIFLNLAKVCIPYAFSALHLQGPSSLITAFIIFLLASVWIWLL